MLPRFRYADDAVAATLPRCRQPPALMSAYAAIALPRYADVTPCH